MSEEEKFTPAGADNDHDNDIHSEKEEAPKRQQSESIVGEEHIQGIQQQINDLEININDAEIEFTEKRDEISQREGKKPFEIWKKIQQECGTELKRLEKLRAQEKQLRREAISFQLKDLVTSEEKAGDLYLFIPESISLEEARCLLEKSRDSQKFTESCQQGFDLLKEINKNDFLKLANKLQVGDRAEMAALISILLVGNQERVLSISDDGKGIPYTCGLLGIRALEIGSYYGGFSHVALRSEGEHVAAKWFQYHLADSYTGIDTEEPEDDRYRSEYTDMEFVQLDVNDLDKRFPGREWDVIFGNAFFGYPTKELGRNGEIEIVKTLMNHLRDGGVMWFKNNESMLMKPDDLKNLGLEYVERNDLNYGLWAVRKVPKDEGDSETQ